MLVKYNVIFLPALNINDIFYPGYQIRMQETICEQRFMTRVE